MPFASAPSTTYSTPQFVPSDLGQAELPAEDKPKGVQQYLEYVPLVRDLLLGADPEQQAATLKAKIQNYKEMARSTSGIIKTFYLNEIDKMQAKLAVLEQQAASARTSAQIVQAGQVASVGVLAVGGLALFGVVYLLYQRGQLAAAQRRAVERGANL